MFVVALSRICLPSHHKPEILSGSSDAHDDERVILLFFNMRKSLDGSLDACMQSDCCCTTRSGAFCFSIGWLSVGRCDGLMGRIMLCTRETERLSSVEIGLDSQKACLGKPDSLLAAWFYSEPG